MVAPASFVVQCTMDWFLFCLQACQPVQCNSMQTMKYISLIRVGFVFQPYSLLRCMAAYSVDGTLGFLTLHLGCLVGLFLLGR